MADLKISQLGSIVTVVPATDVLPVVQGGTTYKVTPNQLLGSGGTATLASATITGDLTVDTNVFKVDTTNNAVGINVTPNAGLSLTINGEIGMQANNLFYWNGYYVGGFKARAAGYSSNIYSGSTGDFIISNTSTSAASAGSAITFRERYRITNSGVFTWEEVGNVAGTAMTLNSTGLGVGVTPSAGNGAIQLSAGVGFPATQVASANANTLDDYEEGTWSPTVSASTGNLTSVTSVSARYTKVGRIVTLSGYVTGTVTLPNLDTYFILLGLPFAEGSTTVGTLFENSGLKIGTTQAVSNNLYAYFPVPSAITAGAKDFYYEITYSV